MIKAASWLTSARALSCVMFQAMIAASARPTANAASIARLNFALSPMPPHPRWFTLTLLDQPRRLGAGQRPCHFGADLMLPTTNRRPRIGAEQTIDPSVVVAERCQGDLHVPPVGLRHACLVRDGRMTRRRCESRGGREGGRWRGSLGRWLRPDRSGRGWRPWLAHEQHVRRRLRAAKDGAA